MTRPPCTCTATDTCQGCREYRPRRGHAFVPAGQRKQRDRADALADTLARETEERRNAQAFAERRGIPLEAAQRFLTRQRQAREAAKAQQRLRDQYACTRLAYAEPSPGAPQASPTVLRPRHDAVYEEKTDDPHLGV